MRCVGRLCEARDKENHHSTGILTRVRHPPFGHHRFATRQSFILPRLCLGPPTPLDQVLPPR